MWEMEEDPCNYSEVLEGGATVKILTEREQRDIHDCIITNFAEAQPLYRFVLTWFSTS